VSVALDDKAILERIDYLCQIGGEIGFREGTRSDIAREVYVGTLTLVSSLYGPESRQVHAVQDSNARIAKYNWGQELRDSATVEEMRGTLRAVRNDVERGLLRSLRSEARGEVLGDFMLLAKEALDASFKDVAAVLASAALEDTLKKYGEANGLDTEGKELSDVVNALKAAGLVKAPQGKVLQSFVGIRNKALHAEWQRIEASEVHSVIAFLQTFLAEHFA
jgi:hypothetical protein